MQKIWGWYQCKEQSLLSGGFGGDRGFGVQQGLSLLSLLAVAAVAAMVPFSVRVSVQETQGTREKGCPLYFSESVGYDHGCKGVPLGQLRRR